MGENASHIEETLHNAKGFLRALTGPDDAIANAVIAEIDRAMTETLPALACKVEALEEDHRCQIADMAERFRAVNVAAAVEQMGDLPALALERAERTEARVQALQRENDALLSMIVVASEALSPFAAAVFNDNGDMSVDLSPASGDDYIRAYFAYRRARTLLEGSENAE